ncbi:MAG: methyl-accepting chemotaxis protein [Planctomycetes bacterium]|nr:methyl-accepting chemotaxis protein [Planctomycetota bacterium]
MKLTTKLWALAAAPLAVLLCESVIAICEESTHYSAAAATAQMADLAICTSELVHETQRERGLSATFLTTQAPDVAARLHRQRGVSDQRAEAFSQLVRSLGQSATTRDQLAAFVAADSRVAKLDELRQKVDARAVAAPESSAFYTDLHRTLLDCIATIDTDEGSVATAFRNFVALARLKELAGIERALINAAFRRGKFTGGEHLKLAATAGAQEAWSFEFDRTATERVREQRRALEGSAVFVEAQNMRQAAMDAGDEVELTMDAEKWWVTITGKIDDYGRLGADLGKALQEQCADVTATAQSRIWNTTLISLLTLTITVVSVRLLTRRIVLRPLQRLTQACEHMAQGDLTQVVTVAGSDEIAATAGRLRTFQEGLRSTLQAVADKARQVTVAGEELTSTASSLQSGAGRTKELSSQAAAASQEMSTNMSSVGQSTDTVAGSIRTIAAAVEQLTASISGVTTSSVEGAEIAGSAAQMAKLSNERIAELGQAASEIGRVIEVIQDIAEQTNLLALNATIEAARAGEAGKGFAVVASEVKALARQTAEATEDIRQRIGRIQQSTTAAITSIGAIDDAIAKVSTSAQSIATAVAEQRTATTEISSNLGQSTRSVEIVTENVRQSATASEEITRAVSEVDSRAAVTAQAAEETLTAGRTLALVATELSGLVERFKT